MEKEKIFELEIRRRIYNLILKDPGLHIRELSKTINIPKSTLTYHLSHLKKHGFLEIKSENGCARYYAAKKVGEKDKKILNLFRQDVPRTIILLLVLQPELSQIQMIKIAKQWKNHPSKIGIYLNKHQTTVSYYFNKLVAMDVIEAIPDGNKTRYRITDIDRICDLIITYEKSLTNDVTGRIIKYLFNPDTKAINAVIDKAMDVIFEILPHPYHV